MKVSLTLGKGLLLERDLNGDTLERLLELMDETDDYEEPPKPANYRSGMFQPKVETD